MKPLSLALAFSIAATPARAALSVPLMPTLGALHEEAARAPGAAPAAGGDEAKRESGERFDGLPKIQTLKPVDYVEVPGENPGGKPAVPATRRDGDQDGEPKKPGELRKAPDPEEKGSGEVPLGDSYRFEGKRTAIPTLTIFTPVKEKPGEDGRTETPSGSGWRDWLPTAAAVGGVAATIGGLFFPPLLFLGGLLLGAWAVWKLMGG